MVRAFGVNKPKLKSLWSAFLVLAMCCPMFVGAQQQTNEKVDTSPLQELGDEYHNSIKLLQNRFRIDYQVDEITMVFFREFGSAPVVLVRPDGSKIFQSQADGENVYWYDSTTFDLINIKNPTPGPWQAVGQILPESRVMVLSDLKLNAEPLPDVLFSGEILKQTAQLTNGGEAIDNVEFRDVVSLEIKFVSTNNPNYNNFGAESQTIAIFEDNGRGMDETPLDGIFTGQFNLSVANGEWTPVFVVSTPMLSREQVDPPLMLLPNPIKISLEEDGGGDGYHKLIIDSEREYVDMRTLLIDGKVRFPNGDVQNFSLTEQSPVAREYLIVNYESGVYRIKLTAYGNTQNGRDFILDVPEFTHLVEEPAPAVQSPNAPSDTQAPVSTDNSAQMANPAPIMEQNKEGMSPTLFWGLIIGLNLLVLIVGALMLWIFLRPKPVKQAKRKDPAPSEKIGLIAKLKSIFAKFSKQKASTKSESNKEETESGIIDLSIPKG